MVESKIMQAHLSPSSQFGAWHLSPLAPSESVRQGRTTPVERMLLTATIVLMPLETIVPTIAGLSSSFIIFALLACYVLPWKSVTLASTAFHPVFVSVYLMLFVGLLAESLHPFSSYEVLVRIAQMVVGAVLIAALCRDRKALRSGLFGYAAVGLWMATVLFATSYGALSAATARDFNEASHVRAEVLSNNVLSANLNSMALITGRSVAVVVVLALAARSNVRRYVLFGAAVFCAIATFLPLSRGAIVNLAVTCTIVILSFKGKRLRVIVAVLIIGMSIILWVPNVVFSRLSFSTESQSGIQESRARIYTAAVQNLPEYGLAGVGAGNFWRLWGYNHGWRGSETVVGAHNCFIQATIYWGVPGLIALIFVVRQTYRCLPRGSGRDPLALALLSICVSHLLMMMQSHQFYDKAFAVMLGLLVGSRKHIWPGGVIQPEADQ
jgi:O-Antigen ligase